MSHNDYREHNTYVRFDFKLRCYSTEMPQAKRERAKSRGTFLMQMVYASDTKIRLFLALLYSHAHHVVGLATLLMEVMWNLGYYFL